MKLRFVDIDPNTLNIDVDQVAAAITPRTKMVFAVNLLGNPVEADRLRAICKDAGILLAEDSCESIGAKLGSEMTGPLGCLELSRRSSHTTFVQWKVALGVWRDDANKAATRLDPPHPTLYLRRSIFERFGDYNTSYTISADYDAMLRWLWTHQIKLAYIPKVMVKPWRGRADHV
jgi:hypothetical protein